MRDVKTRAAMEQPKTRQQNAIPRTAVRILQRHYAQQKQERQTSRQCQPVEYATEQVQQSAADAARMAFRAPVSIEELNRLSQGTLIEHLGIVFTAAGEDWLQATMPVDERTRQPYGLLHGGASVVLAETLGSSAGNLCVDTATQVCVGLEINANHLRATRTGTVTGTARAVHVGRTTQVWDIRIENEAGKPVCVSRLTLAVVPAA